MRPRIGHYTFLKNARIELQRLRHRKVWGCSPTLSIRSDYGFVFMTHKILKIFVNILCPRAYIWRLISKGIYDNQMSFDIFILPRKESRPAKIIISLPSTELRDFWRRLGICGENIFAISKNDVSIKHETNLIENSIIQLLFPF